MEIYHPTLWRTCRALINGRRLACLAVVLKSSGRSVGEIAEEAGIPENQASTNLRALQARGLIAARRDGVHIRYSAESDPLVKHAAVVLGSVRRTLKDGAGREMGALQKTLRAFTHSRRLTILKCLVALKESTSEVIASKTRFSQPAVWRHLETLRLAGLVSATEKGRWRLKARKRLPALARTLLAILENG